MSARLPSAMLKVLVLLRSARVLISDLIKGGRSSALGKYHLRDLANAHTPIAVEVISN